MKKSAIFLLFGIFLLVMWIFYSFLSSFGAGTHGSIKAYEFPVKKEALQTVVEKVMAGNPDIYRDTIITYSIDRTDGRNDTFFNDHFNDGVRYFKIKVKTGDEHIDYTFQYSGSNEDWDTAGTSVISIAYAHDRYHNDGGSKGNGDFPWYKPGLKKRVTRLFEKELIDKVDKELGVKRKED